MLEGHNRRNGRKEGGREKIGSGWVDGWMVDGRVEEVSRRIIEGG